MEPLITNFDLLRELRGAFGPWCSIEPGRPAYVVMPMSWLKAKLKASKLDRVKWREALDREEQPEFVCTSFAKLLDGWLEQERLRDKIVRPHAVGRLTFSHSGGRHRVNWAFTDEGLRIIEPQTDEVMSLIKAHRAWHEFQAEDCDVE
jgi:hypothetical protein